VQQSASLQSTSFVKTVAPSGGSRQLILSPEAISAIARLFEENKYHSQDPSHKGEFVFDVTKARKQLDAQSSEPDQVSQDAFDIFFGRSTAGLIT